MQAHTHMPAAEILGQHDPRWQAVRKREKAADGTFFYAVTTTGVYCRPSCAARLPNPRHVRFFATPAEAARAGFRPCKRCKPNEQGPQAQQAAKIEKICRLIETAETPPPLARLAASAGLSPWHFHRVFKAATGLTPREYAAARRAAKLRDQLQRSESVTAAIYESGFTTNRSFYEKSNVILGMTPRAYREGGTDAQIRFAIGECTLGAILVAQSAKGVCAIFLGDDPEALLRDLQDRFPRARLIGNDAGFEERVAKVVAFVEAPGIGLDLPLDVRGTAFQQRVWRALREIPAGATASYGEIAQRIGAPGSARAVAGACAANALAVAIPCHRVVRNNGALSGYRWGVERKRALLKREASA